MSDTQPLIFYDIPCQSTTAKAWSPNTWRARFALTIKGLPHKTEWIEYPDIAALYHKLHLAAVDKQADGSPLCTLPVLHDPRTGKTVADSTTIVRYLDATYPDTPALLPPELRALNAAFHSAIAPVRGAVRNIVLADVNRALNPRSEEYFRRTREAALGVKLEDIRGEEQWAKAERGLGLVAEWLDANEEGKRELFLGDNICYADLTLVAMLMWAIVSMGKQSAEWKRIEGWHGGRWKAIVKRFEPYATIY